MHLSIGGHFLVRIATNETQNQELLLYQGLLSHICRGPVIIFFNVNLLLHVYIVTYVL